MTRELGGTFDEIADDYESRPDYPERVFDILTRRCGLGPGTRALEIGPGTGQATIPMLQRGASVTAVEPGASLARRLRERTAGGRLDVIVSRFEEAVLPAAAFDFSTVSSGWRPRSSVVSSCGPTAPSCTARPGSERLAQLL